MSFLLFGVRKQPTGDKDRAAYALVTFGLSSLPLCNTAVYWVLCLSVVLKDGTQINTAKGCIRSKTGFIAAILRRAGAAGRR